MRNLLALLTLTALASPPNRKPFKLPPDYGSELAPLLAHPLVAKPETPEQVPDRRKASPRAVQAVPMGNPCERLTREAQGFVASTVEQIMMREDPTHKNYWETAGALHRQTLETLYPECYHWLQDNSSLGRNRYHGN